MPTALRHYARVLVLLACVSGPYLPAWLGAPEAAHSAAELRAMIDEAMSRVAPLWGALCAKAGKTDGQFCDME